MAARRPPSAWRMVRAACCELSPSARKSSRQLATAASIPSARRLAASASAIFFGAPVCPAWVSSPKRPGCDLGGTCAGRELFQRRAKHRARREGQLRIRQYLDQIQLAAAFHQRGEAAACDNAFPAPARNTPGAAAGSRAKLRQNRGARPGRRQCAIPERAIGVRSAFASRTMNGDTRPRSASCVQRFFQRLMVDGGDHVAYVTSCRTNLPPGRNGCETLRRQNSQPRRNRFPPAFQRQKRQTLQTARYRRTGAD